MRIFTLASGNYLVISYAGVQTLVYGPAPVPEGSWRVASALRDLAALLDRAGNATAALNLPGRCESV